MTSCSEKRLLGIYENIKEFLVELVSSNHPPNEDQINKYRALRVDYSEYLDYFQSKYIKKKKLAELISRYMKFAHFVLNIYREEELAKFSKILFDQILKADFPKSEVTNSYVELRTYLCAQELKHLQIMNNTDTLDKEIRTKILYDYFPDKRVIFMNITNVDSQLYSALRIRRREIARLLDEYNDRDPITYLSRGKRLRKTWNPAINECLKGFDAMITEIKNMPQHAPDKLGTNCEQRANGEKHSTDEEPSTIQNSEEDFDVDSIPNNQQQFHDKQKEKKSRMRNRNRNRNRNKKSIQPESSESSSKSESETETNSSKRNISLTRSLSSKRPITEVDHSDATSPSSPSLSSSSSSEDNDSSFSEPTSDDDDDGSDYGVRRRRKKQQTKKQSNDLPRLKKIWTPKEKKALERGLVKLNGPCWTAIKERYPKRLKNRNPMDLRDKARNELRRRKRNNEDLGPYALADKNYQSI